MNDALRQTGRTTRMIEKAIQESRAGRAVYVLVPYRHMVIDLQHQVDEAFEKTWPGRAHGIKVEWLDPKGEGGLGALQGFDWRSLRIPSAHPNCVWLLDHSLAEIRIQMLQDQIAELAKRAGQLYPLTV